MKIKPGASPPALENQTLRLSALSFAFLLVLHPVLQGQWTDNPAVNTPVAVAPNDQQLPTASSDGSGGVVAAWGDRRFSVSDPSIMAQRLDENGFALWGPTGIIVCGDPGEKTDPVSIPDGSGGMLVAWVDERGADRDIYAQHITGAGTPVWTPGGIAVCTASGDQLSPAIVADGAGGALIVWQDARGDAGDVYARHVSAGGALTWGEQGVPVCAAPGVQYDVVAAADGMGGVFVGWADERSGNADVYGQHMDASGAPVWIPGGVALVVRPEQQYRPKIVPDGAGGVIAVWVDWRSGDTELYTQRISGAGTTAWTPNGLFIRHNVQSLFAVCGDGAGGAIAGLVDSDGSSLNMYGARWDSAGTFLWSPAVRLISDGDPAQLGSAVRMLGDDAGGGIVVWADGRTAPGWDLYAQRFDGSGTVLWNLRGVPVATAPLFQGSHVLVGDGRGGAIAVFEDNRTLTDDDVYAQRIRSDGSLAVSTGVQTSEGWNLLSIPRSDGNGLVGTLIPGALSAFLYTAGGYVQTDSLHPGEAAWVSTGSGGLIDFGGGGVDSLAVTVPVGNRWVLIGSTVSRRPLSALQSNPPGAILQGSVYAFDGVRYDRPAEFLPGRAYWVFVTQPCTLRLR